MGCARPLSAFQLADGERLSFKEADRDRALRSISVPCRKCAMCRRTKAGSVASRLVLESYSHPASIALTLTYSDEHLPPCGSLRRRDVTLFLKRLRKLLWAKSALRVRYHYIGEYSPAGRPHYHLILYGWWPGDAARHGTSQVGNPQWVSDEVTRTWGLGHVTFQDFSAGAAGYIARHDSFKRISEGPRRSAPYFDPVTGDYLGQREPEFSCASSNPGIGFAFFREHGAQMLQNGWTVVDRRKVPVGSYFLRKAKKLFPDLHSQYVADQAVVAESAAVRAETTPERLSAREACALADASRKRRDGVR